MTLSQQTLHTILNYLLQCHLGGRLDHYFFENCGSNSEILRWQRSIKDEKWTVWPFVLASAITSLLFWTFVSCLASILQYFQLFLHCCHCMWYVNCTTHWKNWSTRLYWLSEFMPFPAMWSSWFLLWDPTMRVLIVSWASTIQAYFVVCFPTVPEVSLRWWSWNLKQCCWHRNFQLSSSIFHQMLEFFIKEKPRNLLALSSFGFSTAPFLLSLAFRCIRHDLPHIWPHFVGSWSRLFPRQSLTRP